MDSSGPEGFAHALNPAVSLDPYMERMQVLRRVIWRALFTAHLLKWLKSGASAVTLNTQRLGA